MAKRLNNLLRGATSDEDIPRRVGEESSEHATQQIDLLATVLRWLYANWKKLWHILRQLSGDDAYERYLAHHTACNADTAPQSRKEFFQHEQQQKWSDIKRCC